MSSQYTPSSRRSKTSKQSKASKKDRDLEMLAWMAPTLQKRTAEARDVEENTFSMMVTRLVGGFNLMLALLLVVVSAVIASISCCGNTERYNEWEFNESCKTAAEIANGTEAGQWACYHKNVTIIVILAFALYLFVVGVSILIAGNLFYGTERLQARSEAELEDVTAELKAQRLHDRLDARADRRQAQEDRAIRREERRMSRELASIPQPKRAFTPTNRYANATPYQGGLQRAHSVGAPSTVNYMTYQTGAPVQYRVQQQQAPQFIVRQAPSTVAQQPRIQIRTSREAVAPQSPMRIRVSGNQPAPSSPGRRTVLQF